MHSSHRSKACYQPKFPRIQRLLAKRKVDEFTTYADTDYMVRVRPAVRRPAKTGN